jgi:hypothetical protein
MSARTIQIYNHVTKNGRITVYQDQDVLGGNVYNILKHWEGEIRLYIDEDEDGMYFTQDENEKAGITTKPGESFKIDKFFPYHHGDAFAISAIEVSEKVIVVKFQGSGELTYYTIEDLYIPLTDNNIVFRCLQDKENKVLTSEQAIIKAVLLLTEQNKLLTEATKHPDGVTRGFY